MKKEFNPSKILCVFCAAAVLILLLIFFYLFV